MTDHLGRVAITGAGGFIGRHLARALTACGHNPLLLSRSSPADEIRFGPQWAQLDMCDTDEVVETFRRERPDIVFHLAGSRGRGDGGAVACTAVNVLGTVNVLEAARRAGVRRVVTVGSADVFGGQRITGPLNEDMPLAPTTVYGLSSAAACQFAQLLHRSQACPVVVLRLFSVYGQFQPAEMFVAQAVRAAVSNVPFEMTHGTQRRDLVYVDDVVRALIGSATASDVEGRVIHIGSGEAHRLRDVAARIWQLAEATAPLQIGARPAPPEEIHDTWADIGLAARVLNWRPNVTLDVGLAATVRCAKERLRGE